RFKVEKLQFAKLDAGQATWADLRRFCETNLDATLATGFTSLRFRLADDDVLSDEQAADVILIDGTPYACGDYVGVPILSADNTRAKRLGLNVDIVAQRLREDAFPEALSGAAYIRWPEDVARPAEGPFGALVLIRQGIRFAEER